MDSEDSDQTGRTAILLVLSCRGSNLILHQKKRTVENLRSYAFMVFDYVRDHIVFIQQVRVEILLRTRRNGKLGTTIDTLSFLHTPAAEVALWILLMQVH